MGTSNAGKNNGLVQFAAYTNELPSRLDKDVRASVYKHKTKYLNALMDRILELECRIGGESCVQELFLILDLMAELPLEEIRKLAPTQNRNFQQMFKQLIQESLQPYRKHSIPGNDAFRSEMVYQKPWIGSKSSIN